VLLTTSNNWLMTSSLKYDRPFGTNFRAIVSWMYWSLSAWWFQIQAW
jgi:hypothetical protein